MEFGAVLGNLQAPLRLEFAGDNRGAVVVEEEDPDAGCLQLQGDVVLPEHRQVVPRLAQLDRVPVLLPSTIS